MAATLAPPITNNLHLQNNIDAYPYGPRRTMPDTPPSSASPEDSIDPSKLWRPGPGNIVPGNPNIYIHSDLNTSQQYRQIRPMRQPLSVPAALRADSTNVNRGIDTPPNSQESKYKQTRLQNDVEDDVAEEREEVVATIPAEQHQAQSEEERVKSKIGALYRTLGARSKRELEDEEIDHVTDLPTTAHWKPDSSANVCRLCDATFHFFRRRHHCRHCGELVCFEHSYGVVRLDQNAHFHQAGHTVRACDTCTVDYRVVKMLRKLQVEASRLAGPSPAPIESRVQREDRFLTNISIAASVGGVEWSTF